MNTQATSPERELTTKNTTPTRVKPQAGATRCPFCHDECTAAAEVRVCRTCLSRHHADCWNEGGACASCSSSEYLDAPREAQELAETQPQGTWLGMDKGEAGLWITLVATSGVVLGLLQGVSAFERMFAETGVALPKLTVLVLLPARHPMLAALALVIWVATAALARKRRKLFVSVVVGGALISLPVLVLALFLPLVALIG